MIRISAGSGKVKEIVKGSGKIREIRYFLERVKEENFYPCNFLTSIKKSLARGNVFSSVVFENQFYMLYVVCYYLHPVLR